MSASAPLAPHGERTWGPDRGGEGPDVREGLLTGLLLFLYSGAVIDVVRASSTAAPDAPLPFREGVALVQLLGGAVAVTLCASRAREVWTALRRDVLMPILVGLALASSAWSVVPGRSVAHALHLAVATAFAAYAGARFPPRALLRGLAAFLAVVLCSSAAYAVATSDGLSTDALRLGAWRGVFPHRNLLGSLAALGLLAFAFVGERGRSRWLRPAGLALCLLVLVKARSAASVLAVSGAVVAMLVARGVTVLAGTRLLRRTLLATLAACAVAVPLGVASPDGVLAAMGRDATLTGRTLLWSALLPPAFENPWLGHGYRSFAATAEAHGLRAQLWFTPVNAHNGLFQLWLELGGVGAVLMAAHWTLLAVDLRRAAAVEPRWSLWLLGFVCFWTLRSLVEVPVLVSYGGEAVHWMVYVASAVALRRLLAGPGS